MTTYENAEVPFTIVDNRQVLFATQLIEHSWLREFVERFSRCFERDELRQCYFYYPEGAPISNG